MAGTTLDYGAPDGMMNDGYENNPTVNPGEVHLQDAGVDAEMQQWEEAYQGPFEEFDTRRQIRLDELLALRRGNKFYALPPEQAEEAAQRKNQSQHAIVEDALMGEERDVGPAPEEPSTIGQGLDVRFNSLHITGQPISQCSTSRLFAYITHYGAQPLGLEWINDHSCNVVFGDAAAARLAMKVMCSTTSLDPVVPSEQEIVQAAHVKRVHDSGEDLQGGQSHEWPEAFMQSILLPRKAQRIPGRLYLAPERDAAAALQLFLQSQASKSRAEEKEVPQIYREMEEEDRTRFMHEAAQEALQKLRSSLWIRWTIESYDVKDRRAAEQSKWYREHGRDAGKEVVRRHLHIGDQNDCPELLPSPSNSGGQHSGHAARRARGRGERDGATMDELDREMDAWRDRTDDAVVGGDPEARRRRRRGSRSAAAMEALYEEMDVDRRERSASPVRRRHADGSDEAPVVRVRGRGRMRAPNTWNGEGNGRADLFDGSRGGGGRHSRRNDGQIGTLEDRLRMAPVAEQRSLDDRLDASHKQKADLLYRIR